MYAWSNKENSMTCMQLYIFLNLVCILTNLICTAMNLCKFAYRIKLLSWSRWILQVCHKVYIILSLRNRCMADLRHCITIYIQVDINS